MSRSPEKSTAVDNDRADNAVNNGRADSHEPEGLHRPSDTGAKRQLGVSQKVTGRNILIRSNPPAASTKKWRNAKNPSGA